jgi:hypothetical protein
MYLTISEASLSIGIEPWQLRRLYNRQLVPEPARYGNNRVVKPDDLPGLRRAAKSVGYLKENDE